MLMSSDKSEIVKAANFFTVWDDRQLNAVYDRLLALYKVAISKGFPYAQISPVVKSKKTYDYMVQSSGLPVHVVRAFLMAIAQLGEAGTIPLSIYNPAASKEISDKTVSDVTGAISTYTKTVGEGVSSLLSLNKILPIAALALVGVSAVYFTINKKKKEVLL